MEEFWLLILVLFFSTNSLDESVQLEEIDEIFGEGGWWDNDKAEEWNKLTLELGQIELNSTDQNPSLTESDHSGQIEPNSTDQNSSLTESDHSGQIEPNSTDQNPSLTESDHSGQIEPNSTDQNPPLTEDAEDKRKRKIIDKFYAIKDELKQKENYSVKERVQIENKIANHLKVNRQKIYKWKKEFGLSQKVFYEKNEQKHLLEKFDQRKAELKRDGIKNSYTNQINKTVAKNLGITFETIYKWKRELGQTKPTHKYHHSEQMELMQLYYEIKDQNHKITDEDIAKMLKIGRRTLYKWKKQFKRQQFHPNSVHGYSVEENATANVKEIGTSNSEKDLKK